MGNVSSTIKLRKIKRLKSYPYVHKIQMHIFNSKNNVFNLNIINHNLKVNKIFIVLI